MADDQKERWALSPAEDDPEIIMQLGAIAAKWASIDFFLVELMCRLLRNDPAGEVIYFSLNGFKARLDVATNMVTELMAPDDVRRELILDILKRINGLNITRNELIHSAIIGSPEVGFIRSVRRPGRKTPRKQIPVRPVDLEQHGAAIVEAAHNLSLVMNPAVLRATLEALGEQAKDTWLQKLSELPNYDHPLRPDAPPRDETAQSVQTPTSEA